MESRCPGYRVLARAPDKGDVNFSDKTCPAYLEARANKQYICRPVKHTFKSCGAGVFQTGAKLVVGELFLHSSTPHRQYVPGAGCKTRLASGIYMKCFTPLYAWGCSTKDF